MLAFGCSSVSAKAAGWRAASTTNALRAVGGGVVPSTSEEATSAASEATGNAPRGVGGRSFEAFARVAAIRRGSAARALVPKGANADASWPTSPQRSSRLRRRQRMMASDSALGTWGLRSWTGTASASRMAASISPTPSPSNGMRPVSSSYIDTPSDHTSLRASTPLALRICSGDMYAGEPRTDPLAVSVASAPVKARGSFIFEIPKSSTFTSGVPSVRVVTKMFDGFRSR